MWLLNDQVSIAGYEDAGEFVLYAVEAGETLLLNEVGRKIIHWMQLHRSSPASEEQLLQLLLAQEEKETMECLQSQIQELMQELTKRHIVQRVTV